MNKIPLKAAIDASQRINKLAAELTAHIRAAAEIGIAVQVEVQHDQRIGQEFETAIITATARIDPNRLDAMPSQPMPEAVRQGYVVPEPSR